MSPSDDEPGSVTRAIGRLDQDQDQSAAELLWQSFFERLCTYAESRLYARHKRVISGEDIASSTMQALCEGAAKGRFTTVRNRDELWQLLALIAARKAINAAKELGRQRRGGNQVRGDSVFGEAGITSVADFIRRELTAEEFLEFQELSDSLMQSLPDDQLREVAHLRMQGYSNDEISKQLACHTRTIERKLNLIRSIWSRELHERDVKQE